MVEHKNSLEKELIRSEKLKTAGQLAAGVVHEIRNPLTTIKGFMQLFQNKEHLGQEDQKYYQLIISEISRIEGIITELLNTAKPNASKEVNFDINNIIEDIVLLHKSIADEKSIEIVTDCYSLPEVKQDPDQIKKVFINIIKNCIEAMDKKGVLTITTNYIKDKEEVEITFKDTGCGMDEETLNKIGTPFYTTKEAGTGLGMLTCFRIVDEMGGSLNIKSKLGEGTTFIITVPVN
ncbi:signal transduction histidine kinase [Desulfitispora alkaliphila]|uniref:ATP-binding protein n=1 Tax=Desulfitispora alkaliphila TaxID=622674 RepID=UPI003D2325A2